MTPTCPHCGSPQVQWKTKAQKWECQDCERRFDGDPPAIAPDPLADAESAYLHRAKALANHADWVEAIETGWPGPVAYTYRLLRRLLRNGQVDAAALVFKDFAEVLGRLSALILAQDLIQNGPPEGVAAIRGEFFGKPPSMGVWVGLADTWSRQAQKVPQGLLFPEIASLWRAPNDKRTALNTLLSEHIVNWRNETIGHGVRGADLGPTMEDLGRFLGQGPQSIHAALLRFADLWRDVTLCDADGHVLMGADSMHPEGRSGHIFEQARSVLLRRQDMQLDLRPWISARRCQVCGQSETYLYDSTRARKTIPNFRLINYENGHPYSLQGSADTQMLELYSAVDRAATVETREGFDQDSLPEEIARLLDEQSVEHDYLSPAYLRNPLRSFIEASLEAQRGGVFWLQAPAHVGKSTFVRGLDPAYEAQFKEDPLIDGLAVAVFYIRREYQYHLAQFADQLRDKIKAALDIRAQNKPLPSLDIEHPGPQALCDFLGEFQRLGRRALLVVIDGLDELAEEHPSIVDYLPRASMMPPEVTLLVTSRLQEELPAWLREKTGTLQDAQLRRIDLNDADYVALMDDYAGSRLGKKLVRDESLLKTLRDRSDGRFLYFAFLVQRLKDGDLKAEDIGKLADPEHLVPQYLDALRQRYANTAAGDLIQRVLLWMTAAEEAYALHNTHLPTFTQRPWMGLPMEVLCQAVEGQPGITPRLTHVLYLLKPTLATWRGDSGTALYRLGIKGLQEVVRTRNAAELDQLHDHLVRRLLVNQAGRDRQIPYNADLDWVAGHIDGFGALVSPQLRDESRSESASQQALLSLVPELLGKARIEEERGHLGLAMSAVSAAQGICDWLVGDSPLREEQDVRLRCMRGLLLGARGGILHSIGDNKGAHAAYAEAIAIGESLRQQLGEQFTPNMADSLAMAYISSGSVLIATGDYKAALTASAKAITIWESLRQQLGEQFTPNMADSLATAYRGRGNALIKTGDNRAALASSAQAITILESLRQQLGEQFTPNLADNLAGAYMCCGNALTRAGDYKAALTALGKAIAIGESLWQQLGEQFTPAMAENLALLYMNRSAALQRTGDNPGWVFADSQAIAILESLRQRLGAQFIPDMAESLATAYAGRGIALSAAFDKPAALAAYAEAITILESLRQQLGAQFTPDMANNLATTYTHRSDTLRQTGDYPGSVLADSQAIAIWESLRQQLGAQFTPEMATTLATAYAGRGIALSAAFDKPAALAAYAEAITIWESLRQRLGAQFTPEMANNLATAYAYRGGAPIGTGDKRGALAAYARAIRMRGLQVSLHWVYKYAMWRRSRGDALRDSGDDPGALAAYEDAIDIWELIHQHPSMSALFPPNMADNLAGAYMSRGIALRDTGDDPGALAAYAQAIAIWEPARQQLGAQFDPDMAGNLAWAYGNRSDALRDTGDNPGALAADAEAIAIGESLRQQLGAQFTPDMANNLARAYRNRGAALGATGEHQAALAAYDEAIAILEALRQQLGAQFTPNMANNLAMAYRSRDVAMSAGDRGSRQLG